MNVPKLRFKEFEGEWEYFNFSDKINLIGGATPSKSNKAYWNGDIVWLSSQEIKDKYVEKGTYKITQKAVDDNTTKMVPAGTPLIVSRSGILARMFPISIPTVEVAINQDIKALIFDNTQLNTDFLVGELQSKESFILKSIVKTGTTVQSVNIPDLQKMKLSLPRRFEEQKKIGSFFKALDKKIQLQLEKIDLLKEQKKGYMNKLFTNSNWDKKTIGDLFTERSEKGYIDYPLLAVTISNGVTDRTGLKKDTSSEDKSNYKRVLQNDIAYNSMRMWQGASGYSVYKGIISPAYTVITPKVNVNSKFYSYYFKTNFMIYKFKQASQGLTSDTWNLKYPLLKNITVGMPPLSEQEKLANMMELIDTKISLEEEKLELLRSQKKYFMQQMFI